MNHTTTTPTQESPLLRVYHAIQNSQFDWVLIPLIGISIAGWAMLVHDVVRAVLM
jgi:hypothetical protein